MCTGTTTTNSHHSHNHNHPAQLDASPNTTSSTSPPTTNHTQNGSGARTSAATDGVRDVSLEPPPGTFFIITVFPALLINFIINFKNRLKCGQIYYCNAIKRG